MPPADWDRVKSIFAAALDVAVPERERLVAARSGRDTAVRNAVLDLLSNHSDEAPFSQATVTSAAFREGEMVAGRFQIVRFIDRGGMGEVYEAWDQRLRMPCALKTLRPDRSGSPDTMGRFEREIRVARNATHDNVCKVFEFIEHRTPAPEARTIPCFTMELIEGSSLAQALAAKSPMSCGEALPLIRQIAEGLGVLHANGIVHRDLKPSNIMLSKRRDGRLRAVLMDFGLAKETEDDLFESTSLCHAGAPYFMAPELLKNARPGIASDIYAFGLVIDEMVTTARCYSAQSIHALCYAKIWEVPIPPAKRSSGLPESWNRTILQCLDANPERRFSSAAEVVAALTGDLAYPALAPVAARASTGRLNSPKRTSGRSLAAVGILIALAVGAGLTLRPAAASISVYEFENQTNEPRYEYFCRGTTGELMRRLSKLSDIQVIPMHAVRAGHKEPSPGRFSLDGMLQSQAGRVRLYVFVTDNRTGRLIWSENFDRRGIEDPVETQAGIAAGTVIALEQNILFGNTAPGGPGRAAGTGRIATLLSRFHAAFSRRNLPEGTDAASAPTASNLALDRYMRGRELILQDPPDAIKAGIVLLQEAAAEDPRFSLAYAALATAHLTLTGYAYNQMAGMMALAKRYADTAVALDPNLAESREALAMVLERSWNWAGAAREYLKALQLKPTLASARRRYARLLLQSGRTEEGVAQVRLAAQQDPYDPSAATSLGLSLFLAGKYGEALTVLEPAQRPDNLGAAHNLADVHAELAILSSGEVRALHLRKGFELADKVTSLEKTIRTDPRIRTPWGDKMHAQLYAIGGNVAAAEPYLAHMITDMKDGTTSPANVALVLTALGRNVEAIDLLEKSAAERDPYVPLIGVMPFFASLRDEPRFKKLIAEMKIQVMIAY